VDLVEEALRRGAEQKRRELEALVAFLGSQEIRSVLEIGTGRGATTWLWSRLATPDATIVTVDLPGAPGVGGRSAASARTIRGSARAEQSLHVVEGHSRDAETIERVTQLVGSCDLLFIDGDHTEHGVRSDWENYSPLATGWVVFHDIVPHTGLPGVAVDRLWGELKRDRLHLEIVDPLADQRGAAWAGIGVLKAAGEGLG
jgi:predicted O-methyltransferase YrrM